MKLLVFALIPPPHHGQSHMVQLMIEGFGGDQRKSDPSTPAPRIECYHVNARFAADMKDLGTFRLGKALLIPRYILEALWCRFRHGANVLYYCPALPVKATLLRDILILPILRPFFKQTILYWHAAGLGEWLESGAVNSIVARLAHLALDRADLALTPAAFNLADLRKFQPRKSFAVPYGIPDPCPDFETSILPRRRERTLARQSPESSTINILYMALCAEEKGILDTIEALHLLKQTKEYSPASPSFTLTVAGKFLNPTEESKFYSRIKSLGLENDVNYVGFVSGAQKIELLSKADLFCFPTYFCGESFGIVIVEAMAFGLPIVTTRWRTIPEFFAADYPGLVDIKRPDQIATAILNTLQLDIAQTFRAAFLRQFTIGQHVHNLGEAFLALKNHKPLALGRSAPVELEKNLPASTLAGDDVTSSRAKRQ